MPRPPFTRRVSARLATGLVLPLSVGFLTGCPSTAPDTRPTPERQAAATTKPTPPKKKPPVPSMPDQSGDTAFLAFVGRLRKAVAARDAAEVAGMMIPEFGYLVEATPEDPGAGRGVFAFWERNNVWPELELVLSERFVPYDKFMVSPPEFAAQQDNYHGYRAGLALVNGGWKFVYFVKG